MATLPALFAALVSCESSLVLVLVDGVLGTGGTWDCGQQSNVMRSQEWNASQERIGRGCRRPYDQRLTFRLTAVVGNRRQVSNVIEVRVTDEARLQAQLGVQIHAASQRAGVQRQPVVDDESASAVSRCFPPMAADDSQLHVPPIRLCRPTPPVRGDTMSLS